MLMQGQAGWLLGPHQRSRPRHGRDGRGFLAALPDVSQVPDGIIIWDVELLRKKPFQSNASGNRKSCGLCHSRSTREWASTRVYYILLKL